MTDQHRPAITPRQRAIDAYEGARERAAGSLSEAPLLALAGGLAAGALIAALLPRTKAETRCSPSPQDGEGRGRGRQGYGQRQAQ